MQVQREKKNRGPRSGRNVQAVPEPNCEPECVKRMPITALTLRVLPSSISSSRSRAEWSVWPSEPPSCAPRASAFSVPACLQPWWYLPRRTSFAAIFNDSRNGLDSTPMLTGLVERRKCSKSRFRRSFMLMTSFQRTMKIMWHCEALPSRRPSGTASNRRRVRLARAASNNRCIDFPLTCNL
jgi:hypothetical protein